MVSSEEIDQVDIPFLPFQFSIQFNLIFKIKAKVPPVIAAAQAREGPWGVEIGNPAGLPRSKKPRED